jgi:hypothetical protein
MCIQAQGVVGDLETLGVCDVVLTLLNACVIKLLNTATIETHQVVMVLALVEFIDGFAAFKLTARQNTSLLKLHQYAVDGGQTNIGTFLQRETVNVLGTHVPLTAFLEKLQNF